MERILGVEHKKFTGKDGTPVEGDTIYYSEKIAPERGQGESADHCFLSKAKLATLNFTPAPGQNVQVLYNRYGKVATLTLISDAEEEIAID